MAINPKSPIYQSPKISLKSNFTPKFFIKFNQNPHFPTKFSPTISCSNTPSSKSSQTLISSLLNIPNWADSIKENGMRKKRYLYNHDEWVQHRSSLRHLRHFLSSLSSRVILSLIPPVTVFTSIAVVIASYNTVVSMNWLPEFFPVLRASSLPYQLTAPALALLLVFRTEASYSRYEEGRTAWTKVIAGTNDLARQVSVSVDGLSNSSLRKALLQYIVAFPLALKCHLIYGSDIKQDLQNVLEADDLAIVLSSKHRPRRIIELISQSLQLIYLEESKRTLLESKLTVFHEGISVCENLMGIPIPLSYTRLTSRFLVLWNITLPVMLWDDCHWIIVPATFISAASLFCIEEVGVLIEEPFPMLALDELCRVVKNNVEESIEDENMIKAHLKTKGESRDPVHLQPNGQPKSMVWKRELN